MDQTALNGLPQIVVINIDCNCLSQRIFNDFGSRRTLPVDIFVVFQSVANVPTWTQKREQFKTQYLFTQVKLKSRRDLGKGTQWQERESR